MTIADQDRFPPLTVTLKDGRQATLRALQETDAEALEEFYAGVPLADLRFYCPHPLDREQAQANAARALSPCEVVLVLVPEGGGIGGYAWYRWPAGGERSTFGICIRRDHQNRGAGRALMQRLLSIAASVGPRVMCLTVQQANVRAAALYQSLGFRIVREQMRCPQHHYGFPPEPEYYMERTATP
jgi:ribosomal protein S18 acetylase RimI-like enzyme